MVPNISQFFSDLLQGSAAGTVLGNVLMLRDRPG